MAIRKLIVPGRKEDIAVVDPKDSNQDKVIGKENWSTPDYQQANGRIIPRQKLADGEYKRRDLLQEVTDKMSQSIEEGTAPWQQSSIGRFGWPNNATTDKPYHGINVLLLATAGYSDPRWCTYEQAKKQGWQVRKDEKSTRIYFYKMEQRNTEKIDPVTSLPVVKIIPVFKAYSLFNLAQIDKAPESDINYRADSEFDDMAEQAVIEILEATGVEVSSGAVPSYLYEDDTILMPEMNAFESNGHYYSTLLKEMVHWTGHETRLNRPFSVDKASPEYIREALRADMASAMISMQLGLPTAASDESNTAGYIALLKSDKKEVFRAAKDAESITRFILRYDPSLRVKLEAEVRDQAAVSAEAGSPDEFFDASLFDEFDDDAQIFRP